MCHWGGTSGFPWAELEGGATPVLLPHRSRLYWGMASSLVPTQPPPPHTAFALDSRANSGKIDIYIGCHKDEGVVH